MRVPINSLLRLSSLTSYLSTSGGTAIPNSFCKFLIITVVHYILACEFLSPFKLYTLVVIMGVDLMRIFTLFIPTLTRAAIMHLLPMLHIITILSIPITLIPLPPKELQTLIIITPTCILIRTPTTRCWTAQFHVLLELRIVTG